MNKITQGKEEKTKPRWLKEVKSRVSLQRLQPRVLCSSRPPGNYCDKRNGAKRESPPQSPKVKGVTS